MTLDTLIEFLTDYRDEFGGDAEVRLMTQQNWPFENRICGVTSGRDMNESDDEDEDENDDAQDVADDTTVYIVEGELAPRVIAKVGVLVGGDNAVIVFVGCSGFDNHLFPLVGGQLSIAIEIVFAYLALGPFQ